MFTRKKKLNNKLRGYFNIFKCKICTIILLTFGMVLLNEGTLLSQSILYMMKGTSSEFVHYKYTVNLDFTGFQQKHRHVNMHIFPSFNRSIQSQIVSDQNFSYTIQPDTITNFTDNRGNLWKKAEWAAPLGKVKAIQELDISVDTIYGAFATSTSYPIDPALIPPSIDINLKPQFLAQSDHPLIINQAVSIVGNSSNLTDAVIKIINWVRYNAGWECPNWEEGYQPDALWTLLNRKGNCVNFAFLSVALLRAAGIPARKVAGPIIHNNWISTGGHAWVEVYYPDQGWIQYESSYWMPNQGPLPNTFLTPRHLKSGHDSWEGMAYCPKTEEHQTTSIITSSPSSVQSDSCSIRSNESATYVLTVKNNDTENADTILINAVAVPNTWRISLSQNSVYIDPDHYLEETRDIAVTISPPISTTLGDSVNVIVTATSQNTALSENVFLQVNVTKPPVRILALRAGIGGTTDPSPGNHTYDSGTEATITAIPDSTYGFDSWSGDASSTDNPTTVTMDLNKSVTANFIKQYTLNISAGSGGTTNPTPGSHVYNEGTQVTITAIPEDHYWFNGWSGGISVTDNPLTITLDSDKSITANFKLILPPVDFSGQKILNRSLAQTEYINVLTWQANPNNENITKYRIYQMEGNDETQLIESNADTFRYLHRGVDKDKSYTYSIVAVNAEGREGQPASVTVR